MLREWNIGKAWKRLLKLVIAYNIFANSYDCGKTLIKLTSKITTMELSSMVLHINMFNMVGMIKIISFTSCK
jgi:hypothetical protein